MAVPDDGIECDRDSQSPELRCGWQVWTQLSRHGYDSTYLESNQLGVKTLDRPNELAKRLRKD